MTNNWKYNDSEVLTIDDMKTLEPKVWGFVYLLTLISKETGDIKFKYIGKKNIFSIRSKDATKKELETLRKSSFKRRKIKGKNQYKYYTTSIKESDWKTYIFGNKFIKDNHSKFIINRDIIKFSTNDSDLSYQEAKEILCQDTLDDPLFLNNGVSIRRFANKIIKQRVLKSIEI